MSYNATVYTIEGGRRVSCFVADVQEINGRLQMKRSNALQCTGFEDRVVKQADPELGCQPGDAAYDVYYRHRMVEGTALEIVQDNCQGYREFLVKRGG